MSAGFARMHSMCGLLYTLDNNYIIDTTNMHGCETGCTLYIKLYG